MKTEIQSTKVRTSIEFLTSESEWSNMKFVNHGRKEINPTCDG